MDFQGLTQRGSQRGANIGRYDFARGTARVGGRQIHCDRVIVDLHRANHAEVNDTEERNFRIVDLGKH